MTYHFNLVCPECGKTSEHESDNRVPSPDIKCGDCLMDRVEIVTMKVVTVRDLTNKGS